MFMAGPVPRLYAHERPGAGGWPGPATAMTVGRRPGLPITVRPRIFRHHHNGEVTETLLHLDIPVRKEIIRKLRHIYSLLRRPYDHLLM
jgi:hypothetical protein